MPLETGEGVPGAGESEKGVVTEYPKWMAQNAGDNKTNERLSKYRTIDEISNAYLKASDELTEYRDGKTFVPGENATDDEKRAFLTSLGVPEDATGYKKVDSKLPDGVGYTEEETAAFNEMAFKNGWTEKQFAGHREWEEQATLTRIEKRNSDMLEAKADMLKHFEKEWGSDYQANTNLMNKGVKEFGGDDFLIKLGLAGNLPEVINFLVEKGRSVADDTLLDSEGKRKKVTLPPGQMSYPSMEGL
ncbi:MAG: hypothetical protein J7L71_05485 [Spirochaetaceae bacterium]|nr:hypothetical protein [Spirochaetaceae bacterium]